MKKLLITIIAFTLGLVLSTNPASAQSTQAGIGLAYNTQSTLGLGSGGDIGIKADFLYGFSESFRAGANFSYFFPDIGSKWTINANLNWIFLNKGTTNVYLIAGYNYFNRSFDSSNLLDVTASGVNLGTGAEFEVGFGNIYLEPKYVLGLQAGFVGSAGLRFGF